MATAPTTPPQLQINFQPFIDGLNKFFATIREAMTWFSVPQRYLLRDPEYREAVQVLDGAVAGSRRHLDHALMQGRIEVKWTFDKALRELRERYGIEEA